MVVAGHTGSINMSVGFADSLPCCILTFTVSGGFANIHPSNSLTINAVEAFALDKFSPEVRAYDPYPSTQTFRH